MEEFYFTVSMFIVQCSSLTSLCKLEWAWMSGLNYLIHVAQKESNVDRLDGGNSFGQGATTLL